MVLTFYRFEGASERVDKTNYLTEQGKITGVKMYNNGDILAPDFRLKYNALVYKSNYCKCEETGRYYFIRDISMISGKTLIIHTQCDTLFTAKNSIYNSPAWVSVSSAEPTAEQYFLPNDLPLQQNDDIESWEFPNECFTKNTTGISNIVLITI